MFCRRMAAGGQRCSASQRFGGRRPRAGIFTWLAFYRDKDGRGSVFLLLRRPYRLAVRTLPFHGGGPGSIPGRVAISPSCVRLITLWAATFAGRSPAFSACCEQENEAIEAPAGVEEKAPPSGRDMLLIADFGCPNEVSFGRAADRENLLRSGQWPWPTWCSKISPRVSLMGSSLPGRADWFTDWSERPCRRSTCRLATLRGITPPS